MTIRIFPAPPLIRGTAAPLGPGEQASFRAAALRARTLYPGSVGELAHRELLAYAEFGYRFAGDPLVPRLAAEILRAAREDGSTGTGRHLRRPARNGVPTPGPGRNAT